MMLPKLVDGFHADSSVLFFAYGQTGSGKTHTILGEISSLSSAEPVSCWGIFSASGEKHLEIDEAVARRGQEGHPAGVRRGISLLWVVRSDEQQQKPSHTRFRLVNIRMQGNRAHILSCAARLHHQSERHRGHGGL
mmetsp:Transcript_28903/g.74179  ORF Transcript_28903/g.74179 Transcript_28903/m.74179 type:complete len:136 (+) Transcript_28903:722-1129(+)